MSKWQPIETLPEGKKVLLFQPKGEFQKTGMIVGSLERSGREKRDPPFFVTPSDIVGYEWECEIEHPTHWMPLPEAPQ